MIDWQTAFCVFLLCLSILISGGFGFSISRRKSLWKIPFVIVSVCVAEWSFTYALEIIYPSLEAKVFWAQLEYIGISLLTCGWFIFIQLYLRRFAWAKPKRILLLGIIPVLTILLVLTNRWHGLIWKSYQLSVSGPPITLHVTQYGWWWRFFLIFSYGLLLWGAFMLLSAAPKLHKTYRWQFALILFSLFLPWGTNALYLIGLSPVRQLDFSPFVFSISAAILLFGVLRFGLFDLTPITLPVPIQSLDSAAIVLDRRNRVLEMNPAATRLTRDKQNYSIGLPAEKVFNWWNTFDSGVDEIQREIPISVDGMKRFYNLQVTPIRDDRGEFIGRLITLHDRTGEKISGEAIALAQIKTEFLAKVSHELRSPLTAILGLTEMLEYGIYGPLTEKQREAVKLIFTTTNQMTRLVNDLLQQSKLERGTFRLDITQFSVTELMERLGERGRSMAKQKGLDFTWEISPEMPSEIRSDSLRLYQIFLNLVENAIKYTHQGEVNVQIDKLDDKRFVFRVQDTGVGIPQELQQLIFNPFQQFSGEPDRTDSGFGLGLSIVKQLVSLMDGEIRLTSEIGKGSCFEVFMPFEPIQEQGK